MSSNPYDETKWGDELKDLEQSWLLQGNKGMSLPCYSVAVQVK